MHVYFGRAYRASWLALLLPSAAIEAARSGGFGRLLLDSLPKMREALSLYAALGFREVQPYLAAPTPGARCFELTL